MNRPAVRHWVVIIEIILPGTLINVVIVDTLDDRTKAIIAGQVQVGAPPIIRGRSAPIAGHECGQIGFVRNRGRTLILQIASTIAHHIVIPVRKPVLIEKRAITFLDSEVNSPEVRIVLACASLRGFINDSQLKVVRVAGLGSSEVEKLITHRLEQTLLAAMEVVALLNIR